MHISGEESQKSREVRQFVAWLRTLVTIPIVLFDERFTTSQANEFLAEAGFTSKQRKQRRDKLAAQILLVSYLESDRRGNVEAPLDDRSKTEPEAQAEESLSSFHKSGRWRRIGINP